MDDILTIKQLTQHYIDRYELPITRKSYDPEFKGGFSTYQKALERIMQDRVVSKASGRTLWDVIKPEGRGVRKISLDEFERQCFFKWSEYVKDHFIYNEGALQADEDRLLPLKEGWDWEDMADKAVLEQNRALEQGLYHPGEEEDKNDPLGFNEDIVRQRGMEMMVTAIFMKLYGSFNWDQFEADVKETWPMPGSTYKEEITPERLQAERRLKSYLNYVTEKNIVDGKSRKQKDKAKK